MIPDFSTFLTIGQLAKLSDVHIKALRYYESIGILKPSYINPENSYRYYSHSHITYVQVIKICAQYGLPLKDFGMFLLDGQQIDMAAILTTAQEELAKRAKELADNQDLLASLQAQLELSSQIDQKRDQHLTQHAEDYLLFPFSGDMLSYSYYEAIQKNLPLLEEREASYGNRIGCYYSYENGLWQQRLAIKVRECQEEQAGEHYLCLTQYHLHAQHLQADAISTELDTLAKEGVKKVLVLETFESPLKLENPHLEMRYVVE